MYLFGFAVVITNAKRDGSLKVSDLVMFTLSPCLLLPVLLIRVVSLFIDVDKVVKYYE